MKKICYVTSSRADYGIVRGYLKRLNEDDSIDLRVLITGSLLSQEYGNQYTLVEEDGFQIDGKIQIPLSTENNREVLHSMSVEMDLFGSYFYNNQYDLIIILGDRYEMLPVAIAAAMNKQPILHIHGGEATYANYDEFIRHCITKMSLYHFTSTEDYKNRVIQLGEDPSRVFNLGSLGAENCKRINEAIVETKIKELIKKQYFVVLFHPETLSDADPKEQIESLLTAISSFDEYQYVFLGTNADTFSNVIREKVRDYVSAHKNCLYFENLKTNSYHYLVKNSICLIGNSSSGIIEAPSLGVMTINIGNRQNGRVKGNSIIDTKCTVTDIETSIDKVIKEVSSIEIVNPYYQDNCAVRYYDATKDILKRISEEAREPKTFYDIPFEKNI